MRDIRIMRMHSNACYVVNYITIKMIYRTIVQNWNYMDGWRDTIPCIGAPRFFDKNLKGWHCHVYPGDYIEFRQWMIDNMKGEYDADFRFNSGDPMYTVFMADDEDASLFKLKWM